MIYACSRRPTSPSTSVGRPETRHGLRHRQVVIDRGSKTNVGELMLQYGGGGHQAAGTCQVDNDQAAATLAALIATINLAG